MFKYKIDFINGAKVEIIDGDGKYIVEFIDKKTNEIKYRTTISKGFWTKSLIEYYVDWNIKIYQNNNLLVNYDQNFNNKKVLIKFESKSLGDSLSWFPYVEEFRKKHNCILYVSTFKNFLFEDQYENINLIEPGNIPSDLYCMYKIGWFNPYNYKNPIYYINNPLQKTITDILGLKYEEKRPKIKIENKERKIKDKYVCIAEFSTANSKHWHYPVIDSNFGWQKIVDWLNYNGYKVVVISKQKTRLSNVIDKTGDLPLSDRITDIMHSEFFIGVGSGLSWLSWVLGKKVVMISGFSDPICEFKDNNIRIVNKDVCYGCFNKYKFDRGDWNWCPVYKNTSKQFECTKSITPRMVTDKIVENGLIHEKIGFDFGDNINIVDNINIIYNNNSNRLEFKYNGDTNIDVYIEIRDIDYNLIYKMNSTLSKNYIIWYKSEQKKKTLTIDIYNKNKLLINKCIHNIF
jgi:autotransporter strand-loop-strand O-heptosyltransferase